MSDLPISGSHTSKSLFPDITLTKPRRPTRCTVPDDAPLVVNFSGGRTSAFMLKALVDSGESVSHVLFANTGKERDETLAFVSEVETRWGIHVTWLEYVRNAGRHDFRVVDMQSASRRDDEFTPFDDVLTWGKSLPNVRSRYCTVQLKIRTMQRYLQSIGIERWRTAIGIRADERERVIGIRADCPSYIRPEFPLVAGGVTEADVMRFWSEQPFDLGLKQYEGNCDACFLKARWKLIAIEQETPGTLEWWTKKEDEFSAKGCTTGAQWREDRSYKGVVETARHPQLPMFGDDDEVGCSCMEGSWGGADDKEPSDSDQKTA